MIASASPLLMGASSMGRGGGAKAALAARPQKALRRRNILGNIQQGFARHMRFCFKSSSFFNASPSRGSTPDLQLAPTALWEITPVKLCL